MRVLLLISIAYVLAPVIYSHSIESQIFGDFWPDGGKRTVYTTRRNIEGASVYHGPYQRFYETGELAEQGNYEDGKREGEWRWYFENGQIKARCIYESDEGVFTQFFPNGQKQLQGHIVGTDREGLWTEWYPSGNKRMQGEFRTGKQHGKWSYWDDQTGQLLRTMLWDNGEAM
jgi:antitoxin component YwqK of YwqJK toxin-antitoxin module